MTETHGVSEDRFVALEAKYRRCEGGDFNCDCAEDVPQLIAELRLQIAQAQRLKGHWAKVEKAVGTRFYRELAGELRTLAKAVDRMADPNA